MIDIAYTILDVLATDTYFWFLANHNEENGLVLDRAFADGPKGSVKSTASKMSSIAACGYFLSILPSALQRRNQRFGKQKCERLISFVLGEVPHYLGLLPHFLHMDTGEPWIDSEFSVLDTAIFLNGCIVAGEAYNLRPLVNRLLDRVEWDKLVINDLLSLGAKDGQLLLAFRDHTSESLMPYLLAVGSEKVKPEMWENVSNVEVQTLPLFTSYYGMGWADLRNRKDLLGFDFCDNAKEMSLKQRRDGSWWGRSAGDTPQGYMAQGLTNHDGTVMPTAALASMPWIPNEIRTDILSWHDDANWNMVRGLYGLKNFNPNKGWFDDELVAIDLGSFYLGWVNYYCNGIWNLWMSHPVCRRGVELLFPLKPQ